MMAGQGLSLNSKAKTELPWSRRRFACLVCGLEKRWDNLINHYKVLVRFDSLESKGLESDVLTHSKYFVERGITKDTLITYVKLHTLPQEEEGSKQMKAELWTPGREVEEEAEKEVEETDSGGGDQWHFQNALFDDIKSSLKGGKSSSSSSMSRRRYPCLACGEVKRWDQLTQHYKKMIQWDAMGIPAVPDQKGMGEKVYQHTALFFEKNFSRDKMPTYRDHVPADGPPLPEEKPGQVDSVVATLGDNTGGTVRPDVKQVFDTSRLQSFLGSGQASMAFPVLKGVTENIFNGACGAFKKEMKEETIDDDDIDHDEREPSHSMDAIEDLVTVKEELMPLCNPSLFFSPFSLPPRLPLPLPLLPKRPRKRKLLPSSSSATSNFPSQSRRFYKCLGCGSSKRWDRLTDHYRKYVVFGPLGQPWVPNLETMTPEQYVHTLAFRDQGFSSDRMPQYKDHAEASQDNDDEFGIVEDGQDSMTGYGEDGQEFLAGQVQDSRDSFDAGDESAEAPSKLASEPTAAPEPVKTSQSLPVGQQPNIKMFWDNKTFSDVKIICNGGEVVAHRLILAAKHPLFYQVLIDCADDDYSVIMMPDHSFADVSDMVEDYYNFKTTENAFNVNDKGSNDHVDMKNTPSPSKVAKLQLPKKMDEKLKLSPFQFPSYVDVDKIEAPDDEEKVSTLPTIANSDTLDRLILKAGSVLCPTYSCKVPGCLFSVQRSLLCIKGHILTEHWGKLG
eukprot:GFUD01005235.1.p1 GENE.GFUD01005235.1~~GFUD01005235.1.p1  ORF type:complete len:730 (-),score=196.26 GFUD01005235.1:123-2312(-)